VAVLLSLLVGEALYLRALRILARRGVRVPRGQIALWHVGIGLWLVAFLSPIDRLGAELLSAHMAEHLLIADLGAPLLLAGMRNPVLAFLLPRPALVTLARRRRLRAAFRTLRRPLVAIAVYAAVLYFWHFDFAFEAAVRSDLVHALQHAGFVGIGMLVWWSALEPKRRRLGGDLWKIGHILGARLVGMFLGMGFIIVRQPLYTGVYGAGEREFGLSPVADQQIAGALMVGVDIALMLFALTFFFVRAARDGDVDADRRGALAA
jgi:cytochrome c oxidase assembly factor CtaG